MSVVIPPPRTKIVATLGPASSSPEMVRSLMERGMNFVRINASYGNHESQASLIAVVRAASKKTSKPVGILYDLQGPKIRIGRFQGDPMSIQSGSTFDIAVGREPEGDELPTDYSELDGDVKVGNRLLIADGQLSSVVVDVRKGRVRCQAQNDGLIEPGKGINLPDSEVSAPSITEKDRSDAAFALKHEIDAIALSFVRSAADVKVLEDYLTECNGQLPIIAKIEKPQALDNLEEILRASWGVMVARGDLGVELSPEEVPMAQKRIVHTARLMHRPVITATQMLESMTHNPRPTRAEASDVANAVLDGSDAVMLSGETAVGRYPIESVEMMTRIIRSTKRFRSVDPVIHRRERSIDSTPEAVTDAACSVARHLGARVLVTFTQSGMTALLAAGCRPDTPILAFTNRRKVRNLLCLVWGVRPYILKEVEDTDKLIEELDATLIRNELADMGDRLVVLMGAPTRRMGSTNLMLVYALGHFKQR